MQQPSGHSGIYCIRNTVSGRCYVGSAVNIKQRWRSHRFLLLKGMHHSPTLMRSWLKHGESAFVFEILEVVTDVNNLIAREQYWIDELRSADPKIGFNIYPIAGSPLGTKWSAEARAKIKGRKVSEKARAKMSAARKGIPLSSEAQQNVIAALVKKNKSPEMIEKVRAAKQKFYSSPEKRQHLRDQALKEWRDRRASGVRLGFSHSEETKLKISISKKGRMTPEHKAAIALSNKMRSPKWQVFGPVIHR